MEEPFDELGGPMRTAAAGAASNAGRDGGSPGDSRSGAAPPAAAFQTSASAAPAPSPAAAPSGPPSNAFAMDSLPSRWAQYDNAAAKTAPAVVSPSASAQKEAGDELDRLATNGSSFSNSYGDYKASRNTRASMSAAGGQPSAAPSAVPFARSESYDTSELIRKYGGYRPEAQFMPRSSGATTPTSVGNSTNSSNHSSNGNGNNNGNSHNNGLPDRSIRDQAMKVLHLVDEQLKTPLEVRRTESGGFRTSQPITHDSAYSVRRTTSGRVVHEQSGEPGDAYAVTRTASGTIQAGENLSGGGRRVPSALAGLNLSRQNSRGHHAAINGRPGRYHFSDPSFREDQDLSEEEDDILCTQDFRGVSPRQANPTIPNNDAPMVDVLSLEQRSAGSRPANDIERTFSGDYQYSDSPNGDSNSPQNRPTDNWNSRYFSAGGADYTKAQQERFLNRLDREHSNNNSRTNANYTNGAFPNISAQKIFASSASSVRLAMETVSKKAQDTQIFGSGSFNFRKMESPQKGSSGAGNNNNVNLRTVWKDTSDESSSVLPDKPPVHKTWQEAMLNKRKRRRIILALVLFVVLLIIVVPTLLKTVDFGSSGNNTVTASRTTDSEGQGEQDDKTEAPDPDVPVEGEKAVEMTTFYVTSNAPYRKDQEDKFVEDLQNVPDDADFLVHLGNIQDAVASGCQSSRYEHVGKLMLESPRPVFSIVGAEDWLKCPDPSASLDGWLESFEDFEFNFVGDFDVKRSSERPEVFSMLHDGVLFFGLHLVSGKVNDVDDWLDRHKEQIDFYFGMLNFFEEEFRAIVMLGNAAPSDQQQDFWDAVLASVDGVGKPMVYLHANTDNGQSVRLYTPFGEHQQVLGIEVPDGRSSAPLRVGVTFDESANFQIG